MSAAVMTRRAFDTRGNLADQLFRCIETPYSDVLEHNTVSPTRELPAESRFWRDPRPALFLISDHVAQRILAIGRRKRSSMA
jgi:hypothetical protein